MKAVNQNREAIVKEITLPFSKAQKTKTSTKDLIAVVHLQ